jgi:hypothetical protein
MDLLKYKFDAVLGWLHLHLEENGNEEYDRGV